MSARRRSNETSRYRFIAVYNLQLGASKLELSSLSSARLWQKSGRWKSTGDEVRLIYLGVFIGSCSSSKTGGADHFV